MVEENVSHYFRTYVKWITGIGVGVAILALIWLTLQLLLGEQRAATLELSLHHVIGPSLASSPPPASEDIPNVSIAIDMEEAKKNQEDLRGNLLQNGKAYPIKFIISQLHPAANSFFSKLAIKVRKGQLYNDMEEFEILPPISSSQISEWIKREIARSIGFDEIGKFFPINLEVNRKHIGLRFVSALPQTLSMDLSNIPYLKLFCRVSSEVLDVEKKLTGAAKSKIPVRPDEEWSITAPMLGEGVTGPEFARMKALASKSVLSFEEEPELLRLVDMRYFGKYAAIVTLIDEADLEDMPTPSSFRFEEISGRIRPSFQLCNAEGLMPRSDQWFHSLMDKLKEQSEFTASYNNTVELLASSAVNEHLIAPLKLLVNEQLLSSINATPFRYAATPSGKLGYVYGSNASAEVKRSFARLTSGGPLLERAPSGVRASLDPQTNDLSSSKSIVIDGNKALLEDLVVREGQTLSVKAGASIQIAPGVSILVAGGTAKFEGSQEAPIRISGLSSAPWGSVVISDGGNAAVNYAVITGGSETYRDYVRYDGAFAVHNASVSISDSQIDGIVSFNKSVIDLENVTFINVIPKIFLSKGAQVLARNVKHIQNTPQHTLAILQQTPHGVPHTEREFKYTIHADWRSQQLLEAAEALQSYLGRVLSDRSKWKAPEFSTDRALYRPDTKVGEFAYADIYIDTDDHLNYKHDISYRYRYRFENRKAFNSYVRNPEKPRFWPFRLEYQGKIGRGHPAPGFSEVYEARFEFRKQSLPFSEDYLAPWSPWDIETFLPFMLAGSYKGISTVSGAEVERFLSEKTQRSDFAFGPRVVVVTERLRQHLNIPTEWGSGPNPEQSNIITLDRSEIFDAQEFFRFFTRNKYGEPTDLFPQAVGVVTEVEIEFERNVSRELDKRLKQARKNGIRSEVARLEKARQAFIDDLSTLRAEIVEFFKGRTVSVSPGDQSKYLQSYEIWRDAANKNSAATLPQKTPKVDRLVLSTYAGNNEIAELLKLLSSKASDRGQKFVFSANQDLVVSTTDWRSASHDILGRGRDVQSAGYIQFDEGSKALTITNRSGDYCTTFESLKSVKTYLYQRSDVSVKLLEQPNEKCVTKELFTEELPHSSIN